MIQKPILVSLDLSLIKLCVILTVNINLIILGLYRIVYILLKLNKCCMEFRVYKIIKIHSNIKIKTNKSMPVFSLITKTNISVRTV